MMNFFIAQITIFNGLLKNLFFNLYFVLIIEQKYNFTFSTDCSGGLLKFSFSENPQPTQYVINISMFLKPTMTPIPNGKKEIDNGFPKSFIWVTVLAAIFVSLIIVLLIKRYEEKVPF